MSADCFVISQYSSRGCWVLPPASESHDQKITTFWNEFVDLKCYPHFKMVFCSVLLDFVFIPAPWFSPPLKSPSICWQQNLPSRNQRGIHLHREGTRPAPGGVICHMDFFHMGQALLLCLTWTICLLFWKVGAAQILCWPWRYVLNWLKTLQCLTGFSLSAVAPSRYQ